MHTAPRSKRHPGASIRCARVAKMTSNEIFNSAFQDRLWVLTLLVRKNRVFYISGSFVAGIEMELNGHCNKSGPGTYGQTSTPCLSRATVVPIEIGGAA